MPSFSLVFSLFKSFRGRQKLAAWGGPDELELSDSLGLTRRVDKQKKIGNTVKQQIIGYIIGHTCMSALGTPTLVHEYKYSCQKKTLRSRHPTHLQFPPCS